MILPRFSIRWMLAATCLGAVFFLIVSLAIAGQRWAMVAVSAVLVTLFTLLVQAGFFFAVWVFAQAENLMTGQRIDDAGR